MNKVCILARAPGGQMRGASEPGGQQQNVNVIH